MPLFMKGITWFLLGSCLLLCACEEREKALLYDQREDVFYALEDFSMDTFASKLEAVSQGDGFSCFCGANYIVFTARGKTLERAIVIFEENGYMIQTVAEERSTDSSLSIEDSAFLESWLVEALSSSSRVENADAPDFQALEESY